MKEKAKVSAVTEPLENDKATRLIRELACHPLLTIVFSAHAGNQMNDRSLIMGDILFCLRNGDVTGNPNESTQEGFYKYQIQSLTPNSDARKVGMIVVPSGKYKTIKLVTVMWVDELETIAGTI